MSITYPAHYKDQFGSESTTIIDDDYRAIRMNLRGVEFSGGYFSLSTTSEINSVATQGFQFFEDKLCAYSLDFELPITIVSKGRDLEANLRVKLECGKPVASTVWHRRADGRVEKEIERIDKHTVSFEIELERNIYRFDSQYGGFETPLIKLEKQFPPETYMKICLNCKFSEYSSVAAGPIRCFRNAKSELEQATDKWDFLELWIEKGIDTHETYLCPEFEKREKYSLGL